MQNDNDASQESDRIKLKKLSQAVNNIQSRYYTSGSLRQQGLVMTVGGEEFSFPMSQAQAEENMPKLLENANVSPFGKGNTTVVDDSVRKACEIFPNSIAMDFSPKEYGILDKIHQALVPDAQEINAEFHKMNIYREGGHFAMHKDTPRGTTCFGTLIIVLPIPFTGGELQLRNHEGEGRTLDFTRQMAKYFYGKDKEKQANEYVPTAGLQWVAMFGDVEHAVQRVTSGHRITLTYILHRTDTPDPNIDQLLLAHAMGRVNMSFCIPILKFK